MADSFQEFLRSYQQQQPHLVANDNASVEYTAGALHSSNSSLLRYMNGTLSEPGDQDLGPYPGFSPHDFMPEVIPEKLRSLFTVFYVIIIILSIIGNSSTVLVILANQDMRTVTNIFLLSLAISDALIAVVNMPVQLNFYIQNEWAMGEALCKASHYLQGVVIVTSILTLTALALDRYYAICHPLRARHMHTTTRAVVLTSVIWVVALLLVIPQLFIQRLEPKLVIDVNSDTGALLLHQVQVCVEYFKTQGMAIAYTFVFYVVLYIFPVATMFATYGTIAAILWRRRPIGESTDAQRESSRRLREKQRVVRMLVVIVVMFAVSWFPFFTVQVFLLFEDSTQQRSMHHSFRVAMAFFHLLGYSNCCVNPIVYGFMNDSFQKHFVKTFRCRWLAKRCCGSKQRRGSPCSCTDAERVNGATTALTRNSALDHTTTM